MQCHLLKELADRIEAECHYNCEKSCPEMLEIATILVNYLEGKPSEMLKMRTQVGNMRDGIKYRDRQIDLLKEEIARISCDRYLQDEIDGKNSRDR
ncbi:MAG: hypothetical protein PVI43_01525 [Candidatus Bathyarchaeota archaeon]|jgi:hypothetical protein